MFLSFTKLSTGQRASHTQGSTKEQIEDVKNQKHPRLRRRDTLKELNEALLLNVSPIALKAMKDTIARMSIGNPANIPTIKDFVANAERMDLFNQGYVFTGNLDPKTLNEVKGKEIVKIKEDEENYCKIFDFHDVNGELERFHLKNSRPLIDGVEIKVVKAYTNGNPSQEPLKYNSVALFAKKYEENDKGNISIVKVLQEPFKKIEKNQKELKKK